MFFLIHHADYGNNVALIYQYHKGFVLSNFMIISFEICHPNLKKIGGILRQI